MPAITRYHPVSHDFNRDIEVVEARKRFGDWIALAWQECLSIGDRNKGIVPGTLEQIADRLAPISLRKYHKTSAELAQNFLKYAQELGWIRVETTHIQILKYPKYHRTRVPNEGRSETNRPKQPLKIKIREDNTSHLDKPNEAAKWPSPTLLIEKYNTETPDELGAVEKITPARLQKARQYLAIFPDESFWTEVFQEIHKSQFLRGLKNNNGHESFRANFDWLLTKGKDGTENVAKVFEGRYGDGHK